MTAVIEAIMVTRLRLDTANYPLRILNEPRFTDSPTRSCEARPNVSRAKVSLNRLRDLRKVDCPLLQPVADHISLISEINPRRESAAESRRQFGAPAPNMNMRGTVFLVCCCRPVSAQIVGEIDRRFLDIDQCFGRNAFGINHVMAFKFDVDVLQFVILSRLIAGDGRAVDQ